MKDTTTYRFLVDLDCILDTRLATLHLLNPDATPICLGSGYRERLIDDWPGLSSGLISQDDFQIAYRDRDKDVLKEAMPTRLLEYLRTLCRDMIQQRLNRPEIEDIVVVVNLWPYSFTENEKTMLKAMVGYYVGPEVEIKTTTLGQDSVTPSVLKKDYGGYFVYDFNRWFQTHHKELDTVACPGVSIFTPALFIELPDFEQLRAETEDLVTRNPFELMEIATVSKIRLSYLPPSHFSVIDIPTA